MVAVVVTSTPSRPPRSSSRAVRTTRTGVAVGEAAGRRSGGSVTEVLFGHGFERGGQGAVRTRGRSGCDRATAGRPARGGRSGRGRRGSPRAASGAAVSTWPMCRRLVVSHDWLAPGSRSDVARAGPGRAARAGAGQRLGRPHRAGTPRSSPPAPAPGRSCRAGRTVERASSPRRVTRLVGLAGSSPAAIRSLMSSAMRWAKTRPSSSELEASRLAPWTPVQDTSPHA